VSDNAWDDRPTTITSVWSKSLEVRQHAVIQRLLHEQVNDRELIEWAEAVNRMDEDDFQRDVEGQLLELRRIMVRRSERALKE